MITRSAFILLFLVYGTQALAQPERAALSSLSKKQWQKAELQLRKSLTKDSINAPACYLLALYFFAGDNPGFQLDSAYFYAKKSERSYRLATLKEREKMERIPLDSGLLVRLHARIDSASFERAKKINTEEAYSRFLKDHPSAAQHKEALELRHEVAYLDAIAINTYQAYLSFMNRYPDAVQVPQANARYQELFYLDQTKSRRLSAYEKFLHENPRTPYRQEIEKHIFQLFTLSGEPERYRSFLQLYPKSSQVKNARNLLFHLVQDEEGALPGDFVPTDSLTEAARLQRSYLVPFFKDRKFGFIDKDGNEIFPAAFDGIDEAYKCGNIREDILAVSGKLVSRTGGIVYEGPVSELDDLGAGFLKIKKSDNCYRVVHKSGYTADACVQDARVLANRILAIKKNDHWTLLALNGRSLFDEAWEEAFAQGDVLALKNQALWKLFRLPDLTAYADGKKLDFAGPFNEARPYNHNLVLAGTKEVQGVLDENLITVIPFGEQAIMPAFFGFTASSVSGYKLYDRAGKLIGSFAKIKLNDPWIAVRNDRWQLLNAQTKGQSYDSIRFEGAFPVGMSGDSLTVHFFAPVTHVFPEAVTLQFIPGKDSTFFLVVEEESKKEKERKKTIYSRDGRKLFTGTFDQVQYAGGDLFIVLKKEKKGLVDKAGRIVLPTEYDAIGSVNGQVISLLKAMKFGAYHVGQKKLIRPGYDKNPVPYTERLIAVYQGGLYGFVDWNNKPDGKFEFEEIRYWSDSVALVKKDQRWSLFNLYAKKNIESDIKEVTYIRDTPQEKLAILKKDKAFGVMSSKRGVVIPLSFTDLHNVGSAEEPLYFTEKHVAEASVFVVIYYDQNGKFLRREVYQEEEDYERIYCPDN